MSRRQRKALWVLVALNVALICYLFYYSILGLPFEYLIPTSGPFFADLIAGEVDSFYLTFYLFFTCMNTAPLFCGFLTLLLGIILKYWIPFFGSNRQTEPPDPSNQQPGQDDNAGQ
jgi:hypothetical protein